MLCSVMTSSFTGPQRRPRAAERSSEGHFGQTRVNSHRRAKLSPGLGLSGWSLLPPTRRGRTHLLCGLRKTASARFDLDQNARLKFWHGAISAVVTSRAPAYIRLFFAAPLKLDGYQ